MPFSIVFTKADKVAKTKAEGMAQKYMNTLLDEWEELPPHFITSSETGVGRDEILSYVEEINKSLNSASPDVTDK